MNPWLYTTCIKILQVVCSGLRKINALKGYVEKNLFWGETFGGNYSLTNAQSSTSFFFIPWSPLSWTGCCCGASQKPPCGGRGIGRGEVNPK